MNLPPPPGTVPPGRKYGAPVIVTTRNILIVGPSGSGKSEIINQLAISPLSDARVSISPVTLGHMVAIPGLSFPVNGTQFLLNLFDTRGFMDSQYSFLEMVNDWNEVVQTRLTEIQFVLFVLPIDRYSASMLKELSDMVNCLRRWGLKVEHTIVAINKIDFLKPEIIEAFVAEFRSHEKLPTEIKNATIIPTCFLNSNNVEPQFADFVKTKVERSRDQLLDTFLAVASPLPFYPKQYILSEKERAARKAIDEMKAQHRSQSGGCTLL